MQIGHHGRTRVDEIILSIGLIVVAIRTALPIGPSVYGQHLAVKLAFAVAVAAPAVWLLLAGTLDRRRRALLFVFGTYAYVGLLVLVVDWTRFGTSGVLLTCACVAMHLYYVAAREIKWLHQTTLASPQE